MRETNVTGNRRLSETRQKALYAYISNCSQDHTLAIESLVKLFSALPMESYEVLYGPDPELIAGVKSFLSEGKRIEAVKLVREVTGWGLTDSIYLVDSYRETQDA